MTLFEYVSVALSIVLSMSIVRSLESAGDVFDPARRDRIHVTWFLVKAFQPAITWWSIWGLSDETGWNYFAFLLCLSGPIALFFQITTLVTREPDDVPDWSAHFMARRRRFFGTEIAAAAIGPLLILSLGDPQTALFLSGTTVIDVTTSIIGIRSESRRVHAALAAFCVLRVAVATIFLYQPVAGLN